MDSSIKKEIAENEKQIDPTKSNEQIKQDASYWEYEAPQFYDFTKMKTNNFNDANYDQDQENDDYFLMDHESRNSNQQTFNYDLDESIGSVYETPLSNKACVDFPSDECFSSAKRHLEFSYSLRDTPLRSMYQNGQTPLKETRPSQIFGKRKSLHSSLRKSNRSVKTKDSFDLSLKKKTLDDVKNRTNDLKNSEQKQEVSEDESNRNQDSFDLSSIKDVLDGVEEQNKTNHTIDVNETLTENQQITVSEDDFHQINDEELSHETTAIAIVSSSMNKSRTSYVVQSPIVIVDQKSSGTTVKKRSTSVHFADNDQSSSNDKQHTPTINEMAKKKSSVKIRNRQATPMMVPRTLNNLTDSDRRLLRFQKYVKRFSQTPTNESTSSSQNDNPKNENVPVFNGNTVDEQKENQEPKNKIEMKRSLKPDKKTDSKPKTINKNKTVCVGPPANVAQKKFISLAQLTSNEYFIKSARKYSSFQALANNGKIKTKPHAPKLLTSQRIEHLKILRQQKETMNAADAPSTSAPAVETKFNKTKTKLVRSGQWYPYTRSKPFTATKARTPVFYTAIRAKIYNSKHNQQQENDDKYQFHAKPMPNFKRIQKQNERRIKEHIQSNHRLITTNDNVANQKN